MSVQARSKRGSRGWEHLGTFLVLVGMCAILAVVQPRFMSYANLMNVARQVSIVGIIATGVTFVIISGGVDLSVGSVAALAGCIAAELMHTHGIFYSVIIALAVGGLAGAINGVAITKGNTPPFVATLGMLTAARGAVLIYTNGMTIIDLPPRFIHVGAGWLGPVPIPVIVAACVMLAGHILLSKTRFGLHVFAAGGNPEGARLSGIDTDGTRIAVHTMSGVLAAAGGLVLTARVFSGQPTLGVGLEQQAIAATIIGGTTMGGGDGSIPGTVLGVLIMGVLTNGLNLLGVSSYWQDVVTGTVIVCAVVLDNLKRKK